MATSYPALNPRLAFATADLDAALLGIAVEHRPIKPPRNEYLARHLQKFHQAIELLQPVLPICTNLDQQTSEVVIRLRRIFGGEYLKPSTAKPSLNAQAFLHFLVPVHR
jgi:hypothetical protein